MAYDSVTQSRGTY